MTNSITFNKKFSNDNWASVYSAKIEKNNYKLYRERTFKNNGSSKCDGDWIVYKNDSFAESFKTLKEAKNYVYLIEFKITVL